MSQSNYSVHDNEKWSYNTMIYQVVSGISIGNITYYTRTTTTHQDKAEVKTADVLLDNVDRGCQSLLAIAVQRGMIEVSYIYNQVDKGMTTPKMKVVWNGRGVYIPENDLAHAACTMRPAVYP